MLYKKTILSIALVIYPLSLPAMEPEGKPSNTQESVQEKKAYGTFRAWKLRSLKLASEPTKVTRSASVSLPIRNKDEKEIQKSNSAPDPVPAKVNPNRVSLQEIELDSNGFLKNPLLHEAKMFSDDDYRHRYFNFDQNQRNKSRN